MTITPEIHLLRGFCNLKFGQKPADAEALFGAINRAFEAVGQASGGKKK